MQIKPDKKLLAKYWLILLTISVLIVLGGIIARILLPLSPKITDAQTAAVIWPIVERAIILMWIFCVPVLILWVKNLSYRIEDDRVTIHKGILTKIQQNIPYRAVTDFQLHRSLYDRFLGIGSIRLQTAGQGRSQSGTGYEGKLSGLTDWEGLHAELRAQIKHLHPFAEATAVSERTKDLPSKDTLALILEELRAIRKALEK